MAVRRSSAILFASMALGLSACDAEIAVMTSLLMGGAAGALAYGRRDQQLALRRGQSMQRALRAGAPRDLERNLRAEIALAAAGEGVSLEREWYARAQLGGLLVAEWRLDEARALFGTQDDKLPPLIRERAAFGRYEVSVLTQTPDARLLETIRADREMYVALLPAYLHECVRAAWLALEGLTLVRMGDNDLGVRILEKALDQGLEQSLQFSPTSVIYLFHLAQANERIGRLEQAGTRYKQAREAFPGTRLANEADTRLRALGAGTVGGFRALPAELPVHPAPTPLESDEDPA